MSDSQGPDVPGQETPGQDAKAVPTPAPDPTADVTPDPVYADRSYRSKSSVAAGVLLLALTLWLCVDALAKGHGKTPWLALATLVLVVPLVSGFTLWPVVRANEDRLVVRNPFRTVTVPWKQVESLQAALSVELRAEGKKYQVWAVPVSLRQRKMANRRSMISKGDASVIAPRRGQDSRFPVGGPGLRSAFSRGPAAPYGSADSGGPAAAWADRVVAELHELRARAVEEGRAGTGAGGAVAVAWTWWVIAPAVAGAIALIVILAAG